MQGHQNSFRNKKVHKVKELYREILFRLQG